MIGTTDYWIERLIQEKADLEVKCLALKSALKNNSHSMFNKGDNMVEVMLEQLTAMMEYKRLVQVRIDMVWERMYK